MEFVVQPLQEPPAPQQKPRGPSAHAAGDLRRLSDQLPDSELKRTLVRLAGRG
jgi:hypothetical protein